MLKLLSACACILIVFGYLNRKRIRVHIPAMLSAFVIDMSIVVYIEITRDAVAAAKAKMGPLMIVHIAFSVAVLVLYFGQIITGLRRIKDRSGWWHGRGAALFLASRLGNFVTSFMVS